MELLLGLAIKEYCRSLIYEYELQQRGRDAVAWGSDMLTDGVLGRTPDSGKHSR
jgi:hypothetical protein